MSCKCKNIIENFQGGTIPLDTIFNGNVQICGAGKTLKVENIIGCSPTTIGAESGCTSATTTVLIVSGKTNFGCDINIANGGGIFSGGTNLLDIFSTTTSSGSTGGGTFTGNTSATCINELWVSNISGCSPVTIGTEAEFSQDVSVSQYIRHTGDADTHIQFLDNKLQLHAGNIPFIQLDKDAATPYPLTINHGGNRVNFRVLDKDSNLLLKTDSEASKVNLYHAGNMKLETQIGGIDVIGELNVTSGLTVTGDTIVKGGKILLDDGDVSNNYAGFGNNDDLKIFHNGGHSVIRETGTGNLYLQSDNNVIISKDSATETMIKCIADGAVELYHNNVKKFDTGSHGVDIVDEAHIEGETPHLTLKRTDNANVPSLRFKGSGGTIGASIDFDGTAGSSNELIFKTFPGLTLTEKFRVTYTGAKVSGELNVTSGLTVTSSGTNTSDTVFLVQDSVGNHIIEGLDTGQVHVGDLVNSALPTNPTLMIGAGKTPNDRGSLAFTSSGIGIGGDNDATGDFLHFLLPGSDDSRWRFDTSSAFGFTLISRQSNAFGSGAGTRSSIYTSRTYGIDFLLGYSSGLGVTDTVGYRFNTKDSTSAGANDIERFVIENGTSETKSYFDNISVLGVGTPNPDTNVKVHISGDTLISGSFTASTMTLKNVPAFQDEANAALGGLTTGDVYQTTGTGPSPLNVAGILMIKQ